MNNGSERQTENVALNTKMKMRLWTPNQERGMMAMNAELETNNGSESQNEDAALNAKLKRRYDGYECRTRNKRRLLKPNWKEGGGSEHQNEMRWWLWTPKLRRDSGSESRNREEMVALNAKL